MTTTSEPPSQLWLDQPEWENELALRVAARSITADEASLLRKFVDDGFVSIRIDEDSCDRLAGEIDRLWSERPHGVVCAGNEDDLLRRMDEVDREAVRGPGGRIHDCHSHSAPARDLYLDPRLHRFAGLILGKRAVAISSILFEYGSGQAIHRDPTYVQIPVPGQLTACWIALENIDRASGPLVYVPGSHRFTSEAELEGVEPVVFTPEKGEVLFWHAGLFHGGAPLANRALTRKSFVVHFSTVEDHELIARRISELGEVRIAATRRLMQRFGSVGFASPFSRRGTSWGMTIRSRLASLLQ